MHKLVNFSVRYPVTIIMIIMGVLLLGYISYDKLGIDLFPDLNSPRLYVEIRAGERPPEEMERQLVENIEATAIRQSGVTEVSSVIRVGVARITVEYAWEKDMDEAFLDLQRSLAGFSQNAGIDELNITRYDPNATPVMVIGLSHSQSRDINELRKVAENYIRNELIRVEGIADVEISGQESQEVEIRTNAYILEAHGLTADQIAAQINSFNRNVSGGSIYEMNKKYVIKGVSLFSNPDDLRNLVVAHKGPQATASTPDQGGSVADKVPVFLSDVADISFTNSEPLNITRLNGQRCLGLSIYKETKFNTVKAVEQLEAAMKNIRKALPGYEFSVVQNQGTFITSAIREVEESALIGVAFAVLILFLFLRRIGATLIVSVAIPISIVATFNLMYFNGLTLNIMTLGGLALGAGMLVDNAIVVMENIFRCREEGMSVKEAAIKGTAQVGGAITASTLTTIIVFLPIVYLHGASGELFKDQAWTVAFSLLSSLFVAILVIPMLFGNTIREKVAPKTGKSIQFVWYGHLLEKILRLRWIIVLAGALMVVASYMVIDEVGSEFMPGTDTREFSINLTMPEGTRLEMTAHALENIEAMVYAVLPKEHVEIFSVAGPSVNDSRKSILEGENKGTFKVVLSDSLPYSPAQLMQLLGKALGNNPDVRYTFVKDESALQSILGTDEAPLVIEVAGPEYSVLETVTTQVKAAMIAHPDVYNVQVSAEEGAPEIEIEIDRLQAGINNISVEAITGQVADKLKGTDAGQLDHEGEMKDIRIRLPEVELQGLRAMTIRAGNREVPLTDLATIRVRQSPREISRRNQDRKVSLTADLADSRPFDHIVAELEAGFSAISLPADYQIHLLGDEQKRRESMADLSFALILSVILVYMVLASQFESLIHPFTILLTIPLAGVGAIMVFYIAGMPLNIMAYIGIIMLVGIAVNDSIILVDTINQLKEEGLSRIAAIIRAGQYRIRPIIMTSLTTILALLPLTFGLGESASLRRPMALAVIGGLLTSTLLTLVVIPCVYYLLDQVKALAENKKAT
ncbi:MAG: efflux RND transporter permease subunit [Cyclobacteriaceae bacterium]|nr:efflux RND transporter permease subunit [Cyclobacteriaceae bacterium]